MKKIFVHIGHSKTGTTTLQDHLFSQHEQIAYLGRPYKNNLFEKEIRRLALQDSTLYDHKGLKSILDTYRKNTQDKPIVISEETFSTVKCTDRGLMANRIKNIFYPCKIIITIRNQLDIIKSYYLNFDCIIEKLDKPTGYIVNFKEWIQYMLKNKEHSYLSEIQYYNLIKYYSDLFGYNNVIVLLFEEFVHSKELFIEKLSSFIGIDKKQSFDLIINKHERKGPSQREFLYIKILSKCFLGLPFNNYLPFGKTANNLLVSFIKKGKKPKIKMDEWVKPLEELFREGNKKISKEYSLPLAKYNYPL
ncbi:MAG: sulfotransferase domain-containing protein [Thermodesulfobacteriota bacterium]|nr:sulfotransferase domain-containing protein [Thermodesulfobacteriota bacterium]